MVMSKQEAIEDFLNRLRKNMEESDEFTIQTDALDSLQPTQDGIYKMNIVTIRIAKKVSDW